MLLYEGASVELSKNNGWTPLHRAVEGGHVRIVELLLEWGADVNARNSVGTRPLHLASQEANEGETEMLELLLKAGANINLRQLGGKTPFALAETECGRGG